MPSITSVSSRLERDRGKAPGKPDHALSPADAAIVIIADQPVHQVKLDLLVRLVRLVILYDTESIHPKILVFETLGKMNRISNSVWDLLTFSRKRTMSMKNGRNLRSSLVDASFSLDHPKSSSRPDTGSLLARKLRSGPSHRPCERQRYASHSI